MGINTGEVEIAGLSDEKQNQVFKVYTKNDTILCEMLFLDEKIRFRGLTCIPIKLNLGVFIAMHTLYVPCT